MAIIAGIDEAGYGPTLGPLVVSGVAFRVPDAAVDDCLWDRLASSCARRPSVRDRRLAIADSKLLNRGQSGSSGLALLERAALVMLAVQGHAPRTWKELLQFVSPQEGSLFDAYPWYAGVDTPLPLAPEQGDILTRANAVRGDCKKQSVECLGVFCAPLPEGHFNRLVRGTRNKAVVLLGQVLQLIDRLARIASERHVRIHVDRLGGRTQYREGLSTLFSGYELTINEESPSRSAYRFTSRERTYEIDFLIDGESRHLPIALASVYSKYVREGFMRLFNDFWSKHLIGLRPTAGYYTDAQRWLQDAQPAIERLVPDRTMLVRDR